MQLLHNARDAQGAADDLNEWKEISNMIYCLIPHRHRVRFPLLRCRAAHWHYHSAILSSAASLRSSSSGPPRSSLLCVRSPDFSTSAVSHKTDPSSFCYFGFPCWPLSHPSLETSLHPSSPVHVAGAASSWLCAPTDVPAVPLLPAPLSHLCDTFSSRLVVGISGSSHFT